MTWTSRILGALLMVVWGSQTALAQDQIMVVKISGAINPVVAEFVEHEIEAANASHETLIILEMDTPGGLDTSMRQIIKSIQTSHVPVAAYVSPGGSRAASAGTFITIASHIAVMAPGTNIGAAHPVNLMGGEKSGDSQPSPMEEKVVNDAAAYIRSLAEARGRNAYWAEKAVTHSQSISAMEAKKLNVIDFIAGSVEALVLAVDGREVTVSGGAKVTLHTEGKKIVYHEMTKRERILDIISNPNIAYILMMMGMVGLYFELSNPGLILPGVVGGISMILALYAMQTLPINYAGLLLIVLGMILFIAELNTPTFGLLSAGGTIALFLGSLMLIDSDDPAMQISRGILIPTMGMAVLITVGSLFLASRAAGLKVMTGAEGLIGKLAVVASELNPEGTVRVHGEVWNAECEGTIEAGAHVVIEKVEGLKVMVKETEAPPSAEETV